MTVGEFKEYLEKNSIPDNYALTVLEYHSFGAIDKEFHGLYIDKENEMIGVGVCANTAGFA